MAKAGDVFEKLLDQQVELDSKMASFINHQSSMIDNYELLMQNQIKVVENHDVVVSNQKTIIKNQGIITHNQSAIINNQEVIVKNQAYLKTFLFMQTEILSAITGKNKDVIANEVNEYLEKAKTEIANGFERAVD